MKLQELKLCSDYWERPAGILWPFCTHWRCVCDVSAVWIWRRCPVFTAVHQQEERLPCRKQQTLDRLWLPALTKGNGQIQQSWWTFTYVELKLQKLNTPHSPGLTPPEGGSMQRPSPRDSGWSEHETGGMCGWWVTQGEENSRHQPEQASGKSNESLIKIKQKTAHWWAQGAETGWVGAWLHKV